MRPTQEELRQTLQQQAQTAIDEMLAKRPDPDAITLTQIEQLVRATGERIMQEMTRQLVAASEDGSWQEVACAECGGKMRYKGQKSKPLLSDTGEVQLRRAHYYCAACCKGLFPAG